MTAPLAPLQMPGNLLTSHNATLAEMQTLVMRYNVLYPFMRDQKLRNASFIPDVNLIDTLDGIAAKAMIYLLHKPPGARKPSGVDKWRACRKLLKDACSHGEFFGI